MAAVEVIGNDYITGVTEYTDNTDNLTFTEAMIHVYGNLTITNTGNNTIAGVPTILMMNRTAQYNPVGAVEANVVPFRLAQAHRNRGRAQ